MSGPKRRQPQKARKENDLLSVKASFVAGVVLIITILKDVAELFINIPPPVVGCYLAFCLLMTFLVLGTSIFDKKFKSKAVSNFGNFLTVASVIIFALENSVIRYQNSNLSADAIIVIPLVGVTVLAGAAYLLFHRTNTNKS